LVLVGSAVRCRVKPSRGAGGLGAALRARQRHPLPEFDILQTAFRCIRKGISAAQHLAAGFALHCGKSGKPFHLRDKMGKYFRFLAVFGGNKLVIILW
jgi:hypothetical protein